MVLRIHDVFRENSMLYFDLVISKPLDHYLNTQWAWVISKYTNWIEYLEIIASTFGIVIKQINVLYGTDEWSFGVKYHPHHTKVLHRWNDHKQEYYLEKGMKIVEDGIYTLRPERFKKDGFQFFY